LDPWLAARNPHANSDVDVIVDIESAKKTYGSFLDLADYLESLFSGRKVDLVNLR